MTARASDVAARLRDLVPGAGDVKVHKLLYYVQGHHLAWHREPAFAEKLEAWANGPVVAELWRTEKYDPPRDAAPLENDVLEAIYMVVSRYGHLTGTDLIRLTHNEDPWRDLAEDESSSAARDAEITQDALRNFFVVNDPMSRRVRRAISALGIEPAADETWTPDSQGALDSLEAAHLSA